MTTTTESPIVKGRAFSLSTSGGPLPPEAQVLSAELQEIARGYLHARARTGSALLETARYLEQARAAAQHGEWRIFLDATKTSDDTAENLLRVAAEAERDPQFADAVRTGRLLPTVASLYTRPSTPHQARTALLDAETPPTAREARRIIQETRPAKSRNVPAFDPPAEKTLVWECEECRADATQYVNVDGIKTHLCDRCAARVPARLWATETAATLARCGASTMFRKAEMQTALDHVRALLSQLALPVRD